MLCYPWHYYNTKAAIFLAWAIYLKMALISKGGQSMDLFVYEQLSFLDMYWTYEVELK
jgi:hypothetical protein